MTSMRARAIDVAAAAFREAGVRAPRTQASTAVDALLAAGLLHDPTPAPDCQASLLPPPRGWVIVCSRGGSWVPVPRLVQEVAIADKEDTDAG